MAISVSAPISYWRGTPASGGNIVSASFTPANDSLLLVGVQAGSGSTLAVSGGGLTWTNRVQNNQEVGGAGAWFTAPVTTGASMTVTVTRTGGSGEVDAMVYVVTGHDSASPIDVTNTLALNQSDPWNPTLFTATTAGRAFYCVMDVNGPGSGGATSSDVEVSDFVGIGYRNFWAYKAADHTAGAVSGNIDSPATGVAWVGFVAIAIKAGAAAAAASLLPRSFADKSAYFLVR